MDPISSARGPSCPQWQSSGEHRRATHHAFPLVLAESQPVLIDLTDEQSPTCHVIGFVANVALEERGRVGVSGPRAALGRHVHGGQRPRQLSAVWLATRGLDLTYASAMGYLCRSSLARLFAAAALLAGTTTTVIPTLSTAAETKTYVPCLDNHGDEGVVVKPRTCTFEVADLTSKGASVRSPRRQRSSRRAPST